MVIEYRIKSVVPGISQSMLAEAVQFAVSRMQDTRALYREPVSLIEVRLVEHGILEFTVQALYTHNTSVYLMSGLPLENEVVRAL